MKTSALTAIPCIIAAALPCFASGGTYYDGSRSLLCASIESIESSAGTDCILGSAENIEVPQFLRIDFTEKTISADRPDRTKLNTTITSMQSLADRTILQGVESDMGWSISIARETGKMSVAVSGNEIAFIVFGACTIP